MIIVDITFDLLMDYLSSSWSDVCLYLMYTFPISSFSEGGQKSH